MGLYEIWAKCKRHLWAGIVSFSVYGFFIDFASSQFRAIFHRIMRLRHCFLLCLSKWVDGAEISHTVQVVGNDNKVSKNVKGKMFFFKNFFYNLHNFCNFCLAKLVLSYLTL